MDELETRGLNHRGRSRARLARLLECEGFDLVEAALWVAAEEYPRLDVAVQAKRLHLLAAEGARRVYPIQNFFARLDGLREYLFEELGFKGNVDEYGDPRNCYLNEVLNRRLGIPLTLSIVFLETARAAGFEAVGVGLPGHFVTKVSFGGREVLVDPYHAGQVITEEDCRQLVTRTTGRPSMFHRGLLRGADDRSMLTRLLMNLKRVLVEGEDYRGALAAVERLLLVDPNDSTEIRDRGFLQAHLGHPGAAIADLETYLQLTPSAPDAERIRGRVSWLRRRMSEMN